MGLIGKMFKACKTKQSKRLVVADKHTFEAKEPIRNKAAAESSENTLSSSSKVHQSQKSAIARAFLDSLNRHDMEGVRDLVTEDFAIIFTEQNLTFEEYAEENLKLGAAIPDFRIKYEVSCVNEQKEDGVIVVKDCIPWNTHGKALRLWTLRASGSNW